jgi:GMP synthase (glutamine-hydrolysing)
MRKILVLQHVAHEILGTLNPLLKERRFRMRYVNFGRHPDATACLEGYSGLIVLGGPMGVYDAHRFPHLKHEMHLIEQALKKNIPILGVCLGAQLLAHVLGSKVVKHNENEVGWHAVHLTEKGKKDALLSGFMPKENIFQLHGDTFDIPQTTEHLALSELCEGQAFRYGDRAYGLQFHLEVDEKMIVRWLDVPEVKRSFFTAHSNNTKKIPLKEDILDDTKKFIHRSLELSAITFNNFADLFQIPEPDVILTSDHGTPKKTGHF